MVEPRFRWTFPPVVGPSDAVPVAVSDLGISARLAGLLAARGVMTPRACPMPTGCWLDSTLRATVTNG